MMIAINGLNIHYRLSGQGKPLVLLHGWGVDMSLMKEMHERLEKGFAVLSLDLPGFGKSDLPDRVFGVYDYADILERLFQELNIEKPILIGHSFGGRLAIILGARAVAAKIVLMDAAGVPRKHPPKYYLRVYSYKAAKHLFNVPFLRKYKDKGLSPWLKSKAAEDYAQVEGMMRSTLVKVISEHLEPLLPQIKVPTLIIWGENDTATVLYSAKKMEQLIPDSGLVVFEGAGHYPYLEQPERCYLILESFLGPEWYKEKSDA